MSGLELPEPSGLLPLIKFGSTLQIPTYFFVLSATFCLCLLWLVKRARDAGQRTGGGDVAAGAFVHSAMDLAIVIMVSGFLGARFLHVAFEAPEFYIQNPRMILEFWRGGFVFYGGFLSAFAAFCVAVRLRKMPLLIWLDVFAPIIAFGYALGRSACLFEGCCYGRPWSWGLLQFGLASYFARYPTQIFAMLWELLGLVRMLKWQEGLRRHPGTLFFFWLTWHALGRLLMEFWRDDFRGPKLGDLSVSTWISLFLLGLGIYFFRLCYVQQPTDADR